jgi:hypothetical protein
VWLVAGIIALFAIIGSTAGKAGVEDGIDATDSRADRYRAAVQSMPCEDLAHDYADAKRDAETLRAKLDGTTQAREARAWAATRMEIAGYDHEERC